LAVYVKEEVTSYQGLGIAPEAMDLLVTSLYYLKKPLVTIEASVHGEGPARKIHLNMYLTQEALSLMSATNVPPATTKPLNLLKSLMAAVYPSQWQHSTPPKGAATPFDAAQLYHMLEDYKSKYARPRSDSCRLDIPQLNVILRQYQEDGVNWMLSREKGEVFFTEETRSSPSWINEADDHLPLGWMKLPLQWATEAPTVYYNPYSVALCMESPLSWVDRQQMTVTGGILADEMGLGKTVGT